MSATLETSDVAKGATSSLPRALWWKAWVESRGLLAALVATAVLFQVIYVWMSSQVELGALEVFLRTLPKSFEKMLGIPLASLATPQGRLAMAYVHPVTIFVCVSWSIARGSDCVSGEIGRGTMEMLLAQPVRRWAIVVTHAVVNNVGALLLAVVSWLGTCFGVRLMGYSGRVAPFDFGPSALSLVGFLFFLTAATTLASACGSDRRRTVGWMCGFYLFQLLLKLVARAVPGFAWLGYGSFLSAFEPEVLGIRPETAWRDVAVNNGVLFTAGLLCYVAAVAVFAKRDLPAPL
ncbi:MAG: ABC transporter permease subunit [Pirellulales bacterium]